jgi:hypothetical protein
MRVSTTPDLAVELFGDVDGVLSGQAIDHQQGFAGFGDVTDRLHLVHKDLVDMQAPGGVEHIDVIAAEGCLLFGALGDLFGFFAFDDRQGINADLLAENRKLFHRGRAVDVKRGHQHAFAVLFGQAFCQFGGGGGFTRALQTDHQDRRWRVVDFHFAGIGVVTGKECDQFVMDDLDDLLARCDGFGDGLTRGFFLNGTDEITHHWQGYVSLEQGDADFAQGGCNIGFGQSPLFGELAKDAGQAV